MLLVTSNAEAMEKSKQQENEMNDWMHCQLCYATPADGGERTFFLGAGCGHFTCSKCENAGRRAKDGCQVDGCGKRSHLMRIDEKLPSKFQLVFKNPRKMIDQTRQILDSARNVIAFQDSMRTRLLKHRRQSGGLEVVKAEVRLVAENKRLKENLDGETTRRERAESELVDAQAKIQKLTADLSAANTRTPRPSSTPSKLREPSPSPIPSFAGIPHSTPMQDGPVLSTFDLSGILARPKRGKGKKDGDKGAFGYNLADYHLFSPHR